MDEIAREVIAQSEPAADGAIATTALGAERVGEHEDAAQRVVEDVGDDDDSPVTSCRLLLAGSFLRLADLRRPNRPTMCRALRIVPQSHQEHDLPH